jgi:phosphoglycerate dehydrogenase-like enzyme
MKIVFHASAGPNLAGRLGRLPNLDVSVCREDDTETLFRLLPDCEVLWHVLRRCSAEMIAAAPRLKLIQKIGVGVNTIDLEAAKQHGIPVCNLPGTNARAVAELTLGLMLSVLRRIPNFDRALRAGTWTDTGMQDGVGELGGRTVGLAGSGPFPAFWRRSWWRWAAP